jgi:hypothetical protein
MVAYSYKPSYLEGRGKKIAVQVWPRQKKNKKTEAKRCGAMAQIR